MLCFFCCYSVTQDRVQFIKIGRLSPRLTFCSWKGIGRALLVADQRALLLSHDQTTTYNFSITKSIFCLLSYLRLNRVEYS